PPALGTPRRSQGAPRLPRAAPKRPPSARHAPAKPGRASIAASSPEMAPHQRSARPGEARARLDCREQPRNGPPHLPAFGTPRRSQGAPRSPASRPEMAPPTSQRSERPGERVALLDPALLDLARLHQQAAVDRELGAGDVVAV